ncbi:MAG TPA: hypothetical protein VFR87_20470 [Nocardioidaceae bacterium]|nr:hypothetical protein [Nocardioidaceae bacterium]
MSNKTCDYTRPGVDHWWSNVNQGGESDDRPREGASPMAPWNK